MDSICISGFANGDSSQQCLFAYTLMSRDVNMPAVSVNLVSTQKFYPTGLAFICAYTNRMDQFLVTTDAYQYSKLWISQSDSSSFIVSTMGNTSRFIEVSTDGVSVTARRGDLATADFFVSFAIYGHF